MVMVVFGMILLVSASKRQRRSGILYCSVPTFPELYFYPGFRAILCPIRMVSARGRKAAPLSRKYSTFIMEVYRDRI